jgi:glycosyltransferase involved in cell wall biosynthesis
MGSRGPEVTVIVTVYNYGHLVTETLDSILASTGIDHEVVIVDDHSTDDSRAVLIRYLAAHPDSPMRALLQHANRGLAAARNVAFAAARAPLVMVMDADNHLYPRCLRVLADALDAEPAAVAAYTTLEEFGDECGLRSAFAWDPERLCRANYIDAQAMFRKALWEATGGYQSDDHTFGWEDWDLWLRIAAAGDRVVHVPQILGRYRVQRGSMIALTNLATKQSLAALRQRYPQLPWPADDACA